MSNNKQSPAECFTRDILSRKEGTLTTHWVRRAKLESTKCHIRKVWNVTGIVGCSRQQCSQDLILDFNNLNNTQNFPVKGSLKFTAGFIEKSATWRFQKHYDIGQKITSVSWNNLLHSNAYWSCFAIRGSLHQTSAICRLIWIPFLVVLSSKRRKTMVSHVRYHECVLGLFPCHRSLRHCLSKTICFRP
jgi:hypothetical protein